MDGDGLETHTIGGHGRSQARKGDKQVGLRS
jgi:hypothetical protein